MNQEEAERDIQKMFEISARLYWLSIEPMLGPIDLFHLIERTGFTFDALSKKAGISFQGKGVDWVVYGGESGTLEKVRSLQIEWIRDGVRQCRDAGVPCFVKQMGAKTFMEPKDGAPLFRIFSHADAADPEKWPEDLRVRNFPVYFFD